MKNGKHSLQIKLSPIDLFFNPNSISLTEGTEKKNNCQETQKFQKRIPKLSPISKKLQNSLSEHHLTKHYTPLSENKIFAKKLISMTISEDQRVKSNEFNNSSVIIKKDDKEKFKKFLNTIIKQNLKLSSSRPHIHNIKNERIFFHPDSIEFAKEILPENETKQKYGLDTKRIKKNNLYLEYVMIERLEKKEKLEKFRSII